MIKLARDKLEGQLADRDLEKFPSSGVVRWQNRIQWQHHKLIREGLTDGQALRGIWRLTNEGMKRAKELVKLAD